MRPELQKLIQILRGLNSAVLAYSGGVDSTLLLKAIKLSGIRALAVTGASESMPQEDLKDSIKMAEELGIPHRIIRTSELQNENYAANPPDRCRYCKEDLFSLIRDLAVKEGYEHILDGSNIDDISDWRPGLKAAKELGVRSPLAEVGLGKELIREISRELGLATWDKPSSPCLASRIPYGMPVTEEKLKRIQEAESFLKGLGLRECRVRDHGEVARIEVRAEDHEKILKYSKNIVAALKSFGYKFVSLDLEGFKSGSLNRLLDDKHK
jgi:uncharacterized protein